MAGVFCLGYPVLVSGLRLLSECSNAADDLLAQAEPGGAVSGQDMGSGWEPEAERIPGRPFRGPVPGPRDRSGSDSRAGPIWPDRLF